MTDGNADLQFIFGTLTEEDMASFPTYKRERHFHEVIIDGSEEQVSSIKKWVVKALVLCTPILSLFMQSLVNALLHPFHSHG